MTYRSDHDAALARIEALEAENARLQAALKNQSGRDRTPPTKRSSWRRWLHVAILIPVVVGMGAAIYGLTSGHFVRQAYSPRDEELYRCAAFLAGRSGRTMPLEQVVRTTGCRPEIRNRLDHAVLRFEERNALEHWRCAEDVLATKVWVLTMFYASRRADDPNGAELWTEYNDAYDARQDALTEWLAAR